MFLSVDLFVATQAISNLLSNKSIIICFGRLPESYHQIPLLDTSISEISADVMRHCLFCVDVLFLLPRVVVGVIFIFSI